MLRLIAYILFAFSLCGSAWATDYYVAQSDGCDGYDGLADHYVSGTNGAYWSITKAAAVMVAGDTVYIRSGNYNARLIPPNSGTEAAWITYKNYTGESPVLDGSLLSFATQNALIYNQKNYIHIEGITCTGVANAAAYVILWLGATTPNTYRCGFNVIDVTVRDCNALNPIAIVGQYGARSATVKDCDVYSCTTNAMEAIRVDGNTWYWKFLNNWARDTSNIAFVANGKPTLSELQPHYGHMSGNRADRCGLADTGNAFYLDGAMYTIVENNVAYNTHGGLAVACETAGLSCTANIVRKNLTVGTWHYGVIIGSAADRGDTRLNRIYNNTTVDNDNIGLLLGFYKNGATNKAINNLWSTSVDPNYMVYSYVGNTVTSAAYGLNFNLHYPNNEVYQIKETNYSGLAEWIAAADGNDFATLGSNPLLTATYALGAGSPAIDAGNTLTTTADAGTGTTLSVVDSRFFHDTYNGWVTADSIQVGADTVTITSIDYASNSITVSASFTWESGEGVALPYNGSKPDIGYAEYSDSGSSGTNYTPTVRRTGRAWKNMLPWKW